MWITLCTLALVLLMSLLNTLSWSSIGNNLIAGLMTVPLTVSLVMWITEKERKRLDGNWASEVIFMPLIDVRLLIVQAAQFILADDPVGVEASEKWMPIAEELARKRATLSPLFTREILLSVVELESALRRVDFVTARGDDSRKAYAQDIFGLWGRYHHLMDKLLSEDYLRKDLLARPKELVALQNKYNWTETGQDRDEAAMIRRALGNKGPSLG